MSAVQCSLTTNMFQRFMIKMNNKLFGLQIMLPCFQTSHKIVQFFIISGIIQNRTAQFFTKICNWFSFLQQNTN
jgi:hypothetical protein